MQLGRSVSGVMFLFAAVSAVVPLGVRSCRRLKRVILENPQAVDELLAGLAVLEDRVNIMCELAMASPADGAVPSAPDVGTEHVAAPVVEVGPASAITDVSTVAPCAQAGDEMARMSSPLASVSDDLVHLMPADWESPTAARQGITIDGEDILNPNVVVATDPGESSVENMAVSEIGPDGSLQASVVSVSGDNAQI